jgi:hypothetical protein
LQVPHTNVKPVDGEDVRFGVSQQHQIRATWIPDGGRAAGLAERLASRTRKLLSVFDYVECDISDRCAVRGYAESLHYLKSVIRTRAAHPKSLRPS